MSEDDENKKIVQDILKRKITAAQVPEKSIPKIILALDDAKQKSIQSGNVREVQYIHKTLTELQRRHKKKSIQSRAITTRNPHDTKTAMNIEMLDNILRELVGGGNVQEYYSQQIPQLILRCKEHISITSKQKDYDKAQRYEDVYQQLQDAQASFSHKSKKSVKHEKTYQSLEQSEEKLKQTKEEYQNAILQFESQCQGRRDMLKDKHKEQLENFDLETSQGPSEVSFKKSTNLLNLRVKQKQMVATKFYDQAADVKDLADEMEAKEREVFINQFRLDREKQRNQLISTQENEMRVLNDQMESEKISIVKDYEYQIQTQELAVTNRKRKESEAAKYAGEPDADKMRSTVQPSKSNVFLTDLKESRKSVATQTRLRYKFLKPQSA